MKHAFQAPRWARPAHLQTLWGPLLRRPAPLPRHAQRLPLADGDHLWLHWAGPPAVDGKPLVLLLHGLAGCQESHYIHGLQATLAQRHLSSLVINGRGAGHRHNDRARFYHAGETADISEAIHWLAGQLPHSPLLIAGFSIGGSRLLNWLAEGGHPQVRAAVAVSVPFLLADCSEHLDRGFSRIYRNHLIGQLVADIQAKRAHLQRVAPDEAARLEALGELGRIRTFREFDDTIIAPLHGFADAGDYYQRCSSRPRLAHIETPTLLLQAADDPFMPARVVPSEHQLGPEMTLRLSRHGGHVGFVGGSPLRPRYWLDDAIPSFFSPWLG